MVLERNNDEIAGNYYRFHSISQFNSHDYPDICAYFIRKESVGKSSLIKFIQTIIDIFSVRKESRCITAHF